MKKVAELSKILPKMTFLLKYGGKTDKKDVDCYQIVIASECVAIFKVIHDVLALNAFKIAKIGV